MLPHNIYTTIITVIAIINSGLKSLTFTHCFNTEKINNKPKIKATTKKIIFGLLNIGLFILIVRRSIKQCVH